MSATVNTVARPVKPRSESGNPSGFRSDAGRYPSRPRSDRPSRGGRPSSQRGTGKAGRSGQASKPFDADHEILFQKFFKSVGPRTYAAQVKRATNKNHYLVFTEGKRDEKTGDVRKTRLIVYSEDFVEFFRMVKSAAEFIRSNPLPENVRRQRDAFWAKSSGAPTVSTTAVASPAKASVAPPPHHPVGSHAGFKR